MPATRSWLSATAANNRVYAVAGADDGGAKTTTNFEYDPYVDAWTYRVTLPAGERNEHAGVMVNNRMYIIGGTRSVTEEFDPGFYYVHRKD